MLYKAKEEDNIKTLNLFARIKGKDKLFITF
jgi:hypothetical protein